VETPPEERSPVAVASQWASRVMTVSLEMVLPGMFGYWVDQKLGKEPLFTMIGFVLGVTAAIWHLIQMTSSEKNNGLSSEGGRSSAKNGGSDRKSFEEGKPKP
jgi:F0F1-type ATP synthase assembly protein I